MDLIKNQYNLIETRQIQLPIGSRKSGRSGVKCIMLGSGLGGARAAVVLTLLASAGGRRREAAGPGPGWIGQ